MLFERPLGGGTAHVERLHTLHTRTTHTHHTHTHIHTHTHTHTHIFWFLNYKMYRFENKEDKTHLDAKND